MTFNLSEEREGYLAQWQRPGKERTPLSPSNPTKHISHALTTDYVSFVGYFIHSCWVTKFKKATCTQGAQVPLKKKVQKGAVELYDSQYILCGRKKDIG